ncbi:unnamed protein product [Bemisia tabaci]|uniref:Cytochrome P450 n=1 Tax=Bemisia tabaci TaxID=7038 RepID=A0A9P0AJQ8_BEMTA|nr:unnamed protein product [Bemisia tabaci]
MILLILFAVVGCIALFRLIQRSLIWHRQFNILEKLPGPPLKYKILGHLKEAVVSPEELPTEMHKQFKEYGGIYRLWLVYYPTVFIAEAKYAEIFFTSEATQAKPELYRLLHVWLGLGLLTSKGQMWHERRKLLTPAFHFSKLNEFCEVFVKNTLTLVQQLHKYPDGSLIDVFKIIKLLTLDNICESAMGIEINALKNPNNNYIRAVEDCIHMSQERVVKPWYWFDLPFFIMSCGKKYWRDLNTIFELTDKAISNGKNARMDVKSKSKKKNDEEPNRMAFLDLLLSTCEDRSVSLSDEDLRDEVNTFILEGHDTAAASISFTLFLLGAYPEIQEKCYSELREIFQDSNRSPSVEDLQKMKYLEQVIKESLRLFPSVPILGREAAEDVIMDGYTIPKETTILLNVYNLHRDPKVFPDPEKFDPERFCQEQCSGRHPYSFVPFAAGPRNCIGQKFALMEEKVILSYILRDYLLESEHGIDELQLSFQLIIRSQKSLNVFFHRRKPDLTQL